MKSVFLAAPALTIVGGVTALPRELYLMVVNLSIAALHRCYHRHCGLNLRPQSNVSLIAPATPPARPHRHPLPRIRRKTPGADPWNAPARTDENTSRIPRVFTLESAVSGGDGSRALPLLHEQE